LFPPPSVATIEARRFLLLPLKVTLQWPANRMEKVAGAARTLGLASLAISTRALESGNAGDDGQYANLESQLAAFTTQRDALAGQMSALLEGAEFHGQKIDPQQSQSLVQQGQVLLDAVNAVANGQ